MTKTTMIKAENRNVVAEVNNEVVAKTTKKVANRKIIKKQLSSKVVTSTINDRIKDVCKAADIKTSKLDVSKYDACHTQASLIDAMIRNKEKLSDIVERVATQFFAKDEKKASTRILRHMKHDESSRVIKRNALLNSL